MTSLIIKPATTAIIPTITASVSPSTSVKVGDTIELNWTSTDAAVLKITGLVQSTLIAGKAFVTAPAIPGTYLITLTATSSTNDVTIKILSVAVSSSTAIIPQILISSIPEGTVAPGASVKFSWKITNAASATIVSAELGINSTALASSATIIAPIIAGNIYSVLITALSTDGVNTATKSISITIGGAPNVTGSFDPYTVTPGQATTLTWKSTNATSLSLVGLGVNRSELEGSASVIAPTTLGVQSVNWTAKDSSGSSSTGKFDLDVIAAIATTPTITASFDKAYTFTSGFPEESGFVVGSEQHNIALGIAAIYKSTSTQYITTLDVVAPATTIRYGYGRAPDYEGLVYWVGECINKYSKKYDSTVFLSNFFGGAGEPDLSRSKDPNKTYNPGTGNGDFTDRPKLKSTITTLETTNFIWSTTNASSVLVSGLVNSILLTGKQPIALQPVGVYTVNVVAANLKGETAKETYTLTVVAPAGLQPSFTGSFSPAVVTPGQTSVLTWSSTNLASLKLVNAVIPVNQNYTNPTTGTLTVTAPNNISTQLVTYTATSKGGVPITGSVPLIIQQSSAVPSVTGSFSITQPLPNQATTLTYKPVNAVTVILTNTKLLLNETVSVVSGQTYTKIITAPAMAGVYDINMVATDAAGINRSAIASFEVKAVTPTITGLFGNQYTFASGYPEESGFVVGSTEHNVAVGIAALYSSTSTVYNTKLDGVVAPATTPRYGFGRAPDYDGIRYWTRRCLKTAYTVAATDTWTTAGDYTDIIFLSVFFGGAEGVDLTRSKTSAKTYDPGEGYGDFYDRPTAQSTIATLTTTNFIWSTKDAATVSVSGLVSSALLRGAVAIPAKAVGTYPVTVTATSGTGTPVTSVYTLTVTATAAPAATFSGSFSPSPVTVGKTSVLNWTGTNLASLKLVNTVLSINQTYTNQNSGSLTVTAPNNISTQLVTYTATNASGKVVTGTVPLIIQAVPIVEPITPIITAAFDKIYTLDKGFPEESGFAVGSTEYKVALGIIAIYKSTSTKFDLTYPAVNSVRYGFGRAPDYDGLMYWIKECISKYNSSYTSVNFLNSFFDVPADSSPTSDSTRSKSNTKTYIPGLLNGDFNDRPKLQSTVTSLETVNFTWSTTNAATVLVSGAVNSTATSGTQLIPARPVGTYLINVKASSSTAAPVADISSVAAAAITTSGTAAVEYKLVVVSPPAVKPEVTGSFSPATITLGQSTTLTWSSTLTTTLKLTGDVTSSALSGTSTITPTTTGTKTVSYTATSSTGTVSTGIFTVAVTAVAAITPVVNGSFSPASIELGKSTTFTWSSTNAATLSLTGAVTSSLLSGTSTITPSTTGTKTVSYTATSSTGTPKTGTFNVQVNAVTPIYPIINEAGTYWSLPYLVTPGQQNTLKWKIDNAVTAKISGQVNSTATSGTATITVPTAAGVYSALIEATSSTGHSLQPGADNILPRHLDFKVVAPASLKGSITSPASLSSKQQRQIVITGDAAAGAQTYTVTLSTGTADTTTGSPVTGTISSGSVTICLKGINSAGTATLTLSKSGYTNYSGSVAYAANTKYSPYTLSLGFIQEYSGVNLSVATWIAENLFRGTGSFTTSLSPATRYGLARAPDAGGLNYWTRRCLKESGFVQPNDSWTAGNYNDKVFLSNFFGGMGGTDLTRSTTASKSFSAGSGYNYFDDRPN